MALGVGRGLQPGKFRFEFLDPRFQRLDLPELPRFSLGVMPVIPANGRAETLVGPVGLERMGAEGAGDSCWGHDWFLREREMG